MPRNKDHVNDLIHTNRLKCHVIVCLFFDLSSDLINQAGLARVSRRCIYYSSTKVCKVENVSCVLRVVTTPIAKSNKNHIQGVFH